MEIMSAVLKEEPPGLAETNTHIPAALARIVRHCLEKSPDQRFQSACDLAFDLEAILDSRVGPTSASLAPALGRLRLRTHLAWLLAGVCLALGIISLTVAYFRGKPAVMDLTRFVIPAPEKASFAPISFAARPPMGVRLDSPESSAVACRVRNNMGTERRANRGRTAWKIVGDREAEPIRGKSGR